MSTKQEEIIQLEKDARELVENIKILHKNIGSYQGAKDELEKTNANLADFIKGTRAMAEKSHKIIEAINEIGSAKIFDKLDLLEKKNEVGNSKISEKLDLLEKKNKIISQILISGFSLVAILQIVILLLRYFIK